MGPMLSGEFRKNLVSSPVSGAAMFRLSLLRNTAVPLLLKMLAENVTVWPRKAFSSDEVKPMVNGPANALALNKAQIGRARSVILTVINSSVDLTRVW